MTSPFTVIGLEVSRFAENRNHEHLLRNGEVTVREFVIVFSPSYPRPGRAEVEVNKLTRTIKSKIPSLITNLDSCEGIISFT